MKLVELMSEPLEDLHEMANIHPRIHGIPDVCIWVGIAPTQHGLRVKVSNVKNKFDPSNNFVIQMPSLDYDPSTVASWITPTAMKQIMRWIAINQDLLYKYETGEMDDTGLFLSQITKV